MGLLVLLLLLLELSPWLLPNGLVGLTPSAPGPNMIEWRILLPPTMLSSVSPMLGWAPRESSPALLRTLTFLVIFFELDAPPAASDASAFFFRRQRRNAATARTARPRKTPITIPAMAPPERPSFSATATVPFWPVLAINVGVVVTVRVTTSPETVVCIRLVNGVGVSVDCGRRVLEGGREV